MEFSGNHELLFLFIYLLFFGSIHPGFFPVLWKRCSLVGKVVLSKKQHMGEDDYPLFGMA